MEKMILLTDAQRIEMGRQGRVKVINEFEEKLVIDKYIEAIDEIIG